MNINKLISHFSRPHAAPLQARPPISRPLRDWNIILYICAGVFVLFALVAGYLYWQQTVMPESDAPSLQPPAFSPEALAKALATYEARATEHETLLQGTTPFADPAQPK